MKEEYKKIEKILYSYPQLKAKVKNLELNIENMRLDYSGVEAIKLTDSISKTNKFSSNVENEVERRLKKEKELVAILKYNENKVKMIENAIDSLEDREKLLINLKYFKRCCHNDIAAELNCSLNYISQLKAPILDKLKKLLII